jgi:FkbM family methyltransferase
MGALRAVLRRVRDELYRALSPASVVDQQGVMLTRRHPAVSAHMFRVLSRTYEREEIALVSRWITAEDRILEVGSAVGFVALYCIKKIGVRDYCVVEANPELESLLRANFSINGLDLDAFNYRKLAVSGEDGELVFRINKEFWSSSVVARSKEKRSETVPARTISSVISGLPYTPNTLVMDIEGGEVNIPAEHFAPFSKILIETHARVVGDAPIDSLLSSLKGMGFQERELLDTTYVLTR